MPFGARPFVPLAALLLLAGGCAGSSPAVDSSAPPAERIATYLERLDRWGYSGAALVARGDSVLAERGFGFADRERGVRNDASTIFDLASLAKQYTAAGVLLLQDRGLLSVHDSLGRFFPSIPADKRGITVHQLLTHTSGLPREVGRDWEETTRETFEQRTLDSPLGF
ncbi:MAG: serine hydrolase domain-containing protein, partial [Gemmatimonadales bacterium]